MLANLFNPVQLAFVLVVILIVFGPDKLPEIGRQLGKALRDLRRTTDEFRNSLALDDHDHFSSMPKYEPPRYENTYGDTEAGRDSTSAAWPQSSTPRVIGGASRSSPQMGDFAAAAFADTAADSLTGAPGISPGESPPASSGAASRAS